MGAGTLLAIDLINTLLKAAIRASDLLQKAQTEGRDVTDEEVTALMAETDALRKRFGV
ncbi:MAG: hypothetical protein K6U74_00140 [Firmicutes bacterium]|nr:hypothetical protein [Bacillota bacterium]